MIELKIDINEIDYSNIVEKVLPMVTERLKDKINNPLVSMMIEKTKGLQGASLKAALAVLPKSTQDDLAVMVLEHYKSEIVSQINKFADEKEIKINISNISVENSKSYK